MPDGNHGRPEDASAPLSDRATAATGVAQSGLRERRRWMRLRSPWLSGALLILSVGVLLAGFLPLRADPFSPAPPLTMNWWTEPVEQNAFARLPIVGAVLRALAVAPDGRTVLAAGSNGTILSSADGGRSWVSVHESRLPAPIVWIVWVAAVFAALPAFRPLGREQTPGLIAQLLTTDRPLRSGDVDAAGAKALALRISLFLRNRQTKPPLIIAITGPWGSGKSSVMNLLCEDLKQNGLRPVWFNAWHNQKEDNLFAALLQAVRKQAVPPVPTPAVLFVRSRLFKARVAEDPVAWAGRFFMLALVLGMLGAAAWLSPNSVFGMWQRLWDSSPNDLQKTVALAVKALVAPLTFLAALAGVFRGFRDRLKSSGLDPGRLMAAAAGAAKWKDLGGQLAFRAEFADALKEVTDALGDRTLTIMLADRAGEFVKKLWIRIPTRSGNARAERVTPSVFLRSSFRSRFRSPDSTRARLNGWWPPPKRRKRRNRQVPRNVQCGAP
ncbi:MAG: hypothetical protein JOY66_12690 [Acetobacteraceae bacterium]|nr:hypothetical protein [Acetobacteraceae bacterium]